MPKTMMFNPYTGKPRDPRDIASDPAGLLMLDPDEPVQAAKPGIEEYEAAAKDHDRLVRELDVILNGVEGAAKQAVLCDIVHQCKQRFKKPPFGLTSVEKFREYQRGLRESSSWHPKSVRAAIERQCDNMATGSQRREFLIDDEGNEPLMRELMRLNLQQFFNLVVVAPPKFPSELRKMWSGTEVQDWLDQNWGPRATQLGKGV